MSLIAELGAIDFNKLTAKEAVELRAALGAAVAVADRWVAELFEQFSNGRPPEPMVSPKVQAEPPVKPPPKRRRGRPVPELKVEFAKGKKPQPIAVGGADAPGEGPKPAQLFQDSYVSREGPRAGAVLPADHPRRGLNRESSVTPEVDMSDFHEVEEEMRRSGNPQKLFQ